MQTKLIVLLSLVVIFLGLRFWQETSVSAGAAAVVEDLPCCDANGDNDLDISDIVYLLNFLFQGGPPPVACAAPDGREEEARRMAGTFLVQPGAVVQRHADRTFTAYTNESAVALKGLGTVNLGPLFGSWEVEVEVVRGFSFTGFQSARSVDNDELVGFVFWDGSGTYTEGYGSYSVSSRLRVYGRDVDPVCPGAAPPLDTIMTDGAALRLCGPAGAP